MSSELYKKKISELLQHADVSVDRGEPWDMQVHNPKLYGRIIGQGTLGLGEAYMDGWWDCDRLDEFFTRVLRANIAKQVHTVKDKAFFLKHHFLNMQLGKNAYTVGEEHYDVGNDLYELMLDKRMIYTCGYWREAQTLDDAQEAKLDLVCKKLELKPGMRVLDIGCGWGGAAKFAAENYGVEVVGVTISKEQTKLAQEACKGLPVEIRLQDYRELNEQFDRIFSLGMFEHVGYKNYQTYFEVAKRCLKDKGLFLLHTIGGSKTTSRIDPWISKYIFQNSALPSAQSITSNTEGLFTIEDWHNFRNDYDKTLLQWHKNVNNNWDKLSGNYSERFQRMWSYYLMAAAATFRSGQSQLWQIVLSKGDLNNTYTSIR